MRTATLRWGRRRTAIAITLAVVATLLTTITGVPNAAAAGEQFNFVSSASATDEGVDPNIRIRLNNTAPNVAPITVTVSATAGSASAPGDYTLNSATVVFPALAPTASELPVDIDLNVDSTYENSESFTLTIVSTSLGAGAIGPDNVHTATINNVDPPPVLTIADVPPVAEEPGPMRFTITRTGLTQLPVTATATPSSGTADIVNDFSAATGSIMIPAGGVTGTDQFDVALVADDVYEPNETLAVTLSAVTGARTAPPSDLTAVGTILDNDPKPTLSINDVSVSEANGTATFSISRAGRTAFDTDFDIDTAGATATEGDDFTGRTDSLTIASGGASGSATFVVPIIDDDSAEGPETYTVTLADAPEATLLKPVGTGTILDNDTAGITIDAGDGVFVLEGAAPDSFNVALSSEPTASVTIEPSSTLGEVTVTPSSLVFTPANWDIPQSLSVEAIEDGIDEDDPHPDVIAFEATSTDPGYAGVALSTLAIDVGDADALLVTIEGPEVGAPGQQASFSAVVNAGGAGSITYEWTAFYQGTQVASGEQANFSFTPAEGGSYNIQVIIGDDEGQSPAKFIQFRALADLDGSIFSADIIWLAQAGITAGCNPPANTEFCPKDIVTRGQMAAFLVRFLDLTDDGGGNTFTDDNGSIFETDIAKLATAGITKGCNPPANTQFCPNSPVTREQMAAFVVRALALSDDGGGNTFTDDNGSIFETDIAKLATAGITKGCNPPANTQFCPTSLVTREQMAAFIRRADSILPT